MLLAKDASAGALAVSVICVKCGKWNRLYDVWADLRGEAFKDYYCDNCASGFKGVARYINGFNVDTLARADSGEVEGEGVNWENARYAYNKLRYHGEDSISKYGVLVGLSGAYRCRVK